MWGGLDGEDLDVYDVGVCYCVCVVVVVVDVV